MIEAFHKKIDVLLQQIVDDSRWDLDSETLFVVTGMTFYGYCLGQKIVFMLEQEDVNKAVVERLVALGAGQKYTEGLVEAAEQAFFKNEETLYNQLINIGHNYFMMDDLTELVDNIYLNTKAILKQR
ncbi:hypothetical protein HX017_08330 [Myroides marinus]|uniref:Uncharacterized protein n=1 Tax=Myroides marinus TaxID=703342 RepID=A0A161SC67_9FLAO|nr:hypothetical protein [Myroides marinus]KUF43639.1 hypothetical protein AS361_14095 [Myroides marinus]KZE83630.1 hypothetical protein AV926_04410 [Myroides marinus]MDM1349743.1 hypothetical protein [Myroides marinus]MDM1353683.1 hypothetical protein [Myroides marinus]MDM1356952.1 hypothetical protein [Myroides marinus]